MLLYRDYKGFLWFASSVSLVKYDGVSFFSFSSNEVDSFPQTHCTVTSIIEDGDSNLWVSTENGLAEYDRRHNHFKRVKIGSDNASLWINLLVRKSRNEFWICGSGHLWVFNTHTFQSREIQIQDRYGKPRNDFEIYYACMTNNGWLWFSDQLQVIAYDSSARKFIYDLPLPPKQKYYNSISTIIPNINSVRILDIKPDPLGNIWIGTTAGLFKIDPETKSVGAFRQKPNDPHSLSSDVVWSISCPDTISVIIGTAIGLDIYDLHSQTFRHYFSEPGNPNTLSNNTVVRTYVDHQGIVWLFTPEDINYFLATQNRFRIFQNTLNKTVGTGFTNIRRITENSQGEILVSTGDGVACIDPATGMRSMIVNDELKKQLGDFDVYGLYCDAHDNIYAGTWGGGLNVYNNSTRKFTTYLYDPENKSGISSNYIKGITEDAKGQLWLATWNGGVDRFDPVTKKFTVYRADGRPGSLRRNFYENVYRDHLNRIWVFGRGLDRFVPESNSWVHYDLVDSSRTMNVSNGVADICEDANHQLWLATADGVVQFNPGNKIPNRYGIKEGLLSGWLYGIEADASGNIWFTTEKGLCFLDAASKKIRVFTTADGLPTNRFALGSYYDPREGTMWFGSLSGLVSFKPENFFINDQPPVVVLTSLKLFGRDYSSGDELDATKEIHFSHNQNEWQFEFAALNFISKDNNQYAYQLIGHDSSWIYCGNHSSANYTNLNPGDYTFRVKASNNDGVWNEEGKSIHLSIAPPFWNTWWFYFLTAIAGASIIYSIYRYQLSKALALQAVRNRISRDLHDEVGSTLSSISILSKVAMVEKQGDNGNMKTIVGKIGESSHRMLEAMDDIIWSVNPRNDAMSNILVRMKEVAADFLEPKNILYEIIIAPELMKSKLPMEKRREVFLIYKEALNNIAKYSQCKNVCIHFSQSGSRMILKIEDDGIGFDEKLMTSGNGIHNMQDRARLLKGKIDFTSKENHGTVIMLKF